MNSKRIQQYENIIKKMEQKNLNLYIDGEISSYLSAIRYKMTTIFKDKLNIALTKLFREVVMGTKNLSDVIRCYEFFINIYMSYYMSKMNELQDEIDDLIYNGSGKVINKQREKLRILNKEISNLVKDMKKEMKSY
tara:strand:+ start:438 stop:845 length:408 start_codon:yes stop_codon:yes gene_type:complete